MNGAGLVDGSAVALRQNAGFGAGMRARGEGMNRELFERGAIRGGEPAAIDSFDMARAGFVQMGI